jgi:hypothetical protein
LEGYWESGFLILENTNDTITFLPFGYKYTYEIKDSSIYLLKRLDKNQYNPDTLQYPFYLGSIHVYSNINYIETKEFIMHKWSFRKLTPKKIVNLQKIQFSSGYWSNGYDLEIDTLGNSFFKENGFNQNYRTYSLKLTEKEARQILYLASLVDYEKIKRTYININCADAPRYSFVFYFEGKTYRTYIRCSEEEETLHPLRYFLENLTERLSKNPTKFRTAKNKYFESRLLHCFDLGDSIKYLSKFDSINYHLPLIDQQKVRNLFFKYFHTDDYNLCHWIKFDSLGYIEDIILDETYPTNAKFINELKMIKPIRPAIFEGKKVSIADFQCERYLE